MTVEKIHDKGQTLGPPTGNLVGIAGTRADFDKASRELQAASFKKIEVLSGDEGIKKTITSEITFKGYTVHASKEEPQYLIKSDKTDYMAMHKGSALKKLRKNIS